MNSLPPPAGTAAEAWDVLDQLVEDAVQLSRSGGTPDAFAHELLRRAVDTLAAHGGVLWDIEDGRFARRAAYSPAWPTTLQTIAGPMATADHEPWLRWVLRRNEAVEAAPLAVLDPVADVANPYDATLLAAPILVDRAPIGILELVHRTDVGPDARQGTLRLLQTLADCAADYHREQQRRYWRERAASADEFEGLTAALYAELDSSAVAFAAANEGRRWADCDRVSIVLCSHAGNSGKTLAVSGVDRVDRRSDSVRDLERLAADVVRRDEPLYYGSGVPAPTLSSLESLSAYVDRSDVVRIAVLPLVDRGPPSSDDAARPSQQPVAERKLGAIVCEYFTGVESFDDAQRARLETLADHAGRALGRALECESIPFGRGWRRWYRRSSPHVRSWSKVAVYAALVAAALLAPFFIPSDAAVEARGSLQPEHRRELYAPTDGVVSEVAVRHGQAVRVDDPLIVLRRPELTMELARIAGELQTAESRLAALRTARIVTNSTNPADRAQAQDRTAEEEQLKQTVRALADQRRLLLEQERELTVRATIGGVVATWDVERTLQGRPVVRGQPLVELADVGGPWVVELHIPDRLLGDVTAARSEQAEPLEVEFVTATHPETTYRGRILRMSEAAETNLQGEVFVSATIAFDRNAVEAAQLRPGAAVSARILCGRSSLGAVYTRDLRRFLQSWWW